MGSNPTRAIACGRRARASSAGCNPVATRCGGSTPPVRIRPTSRSAGEHGDAPWGRLSLASSRARVRLPPSPSNASVVSTASTRPLYGRGAGSNPAGGSSDVTAHLAGRRASVISQPGSTGGWRASARTAGLRPSLTPRPRSRDPHARSSEDRALPCDGGGRWFESSRAFHADVAQREEHRAANPGRPVRSGSSASTKACGVTGSTASSNLAGPGSNPGRPASSRSSRADVVRFSG